MTVKQMVRSIFKSVFTVLVITGMSLMFIFGYDVLTQCDYFSAKTLSIEGGRKLTSNQILAAAQITKGVNILSINLKTVRKKLLANPWISQADICRTFPDNITIHIEEEKPMAVLDLGRHFLVNADGIIFKEATEAEASGMPVISGIDYADWTTSELPSTWVSSSVMEVLAMGKSKDGILPNHMIKRIIVDREIGLTLQTDSPVNVVKLGYGDYKIKYSRLGKILFYMDENDTFQRMAEIDLRNPDCIVARPENEETSAGHKKEV